MATNAASKKTDPAETADSPITILKEATCPTNTGKSTLGYQIGTNEKGIVQLKLTSNSGGGHFSSSWISFSDVQAALKAWPQDQPITSMALRPLSRGKSANDAGFACAVLVAEGFLEKITGKSRVHQAIDPKLFKAKVEALKGGGSMPTTNPEETSARKHRVPAKAKASAKAKPTPEAKAKSPRKPASITPRKAVKKNPQNP
ncbi:hypothetical protein [Pseudohalioglobus lutimaris]|uniref:hypothetical protein n=1 Tax=Pseudohalioglobus lutimaris TaxID=1737061 RepID=UPI001A9E1271|nr:hypothetical protein [Pseudohalioglobus lutimaris]